MAIVMASVHARMTTYSLFEPASGWARPKNTKNKNEKGTSKSTGRRSILIPRTHTLGAALVGVHLGPTGGHGQPPCSKMHCAAKLEGDSCSKLLAEKGAVFGTFGAVGESA